jgi:ribosomal protein S18 acetylase RimI-like enzyme
VAEPIEWATVIRVYEPADEDAVVALWQASGLTRPWNDPRADIQRKLADSPWGLLVADDIRHDGLAGSVMVGYDGHRGSVNYLAVRPDRRGTGLGRALMDHVESLLRARGCPKINLQVRPENSAVVAFYAHRGYDMTGQGEQAINLGLRLVVDGEMS